MNDSLNHETRILSGMRPTGTMHLGHLCGALKQWKEMQHQYECYFAVVDWHALTTDYEDTSRISLNTWDMVIDWLAVGISPNDSSIFIQSQVPEHAELHLLLSMVTPLSWLERVPTYREQQEKLKNRDLSTYGFLGYPLLQSADILVYKAGLIPVGEDQVPHVELAREIARRFNHIFGWEKDFEEKILAAMAKMGKKNADLYRELCRQYQEEGNQEALTTGQALLDGQANISLGDRERLFGKLEGRGRVILPEPEPFLTTAPRLPGTDGQKMSKSYNNAINLRDEAEVIEQKVKTMKTDPARQRRQDPGDPEKCPVWDLHRVYSDQSTQQWVMEGCKNAGIGCIDCKKPIIEHIVNEVAPIQERVKELQSDHKQVRSVVAEGCESARAVAKETLAEIRDVIGTNYF